MAYDQTRRIKPSVLLQDKDTLLAIKGLVPTYAPTKSEFAVTALDGASTAMAAAQGVEVVKKGEYEAARDSANSAEWAFHNLVLGAKTQVIAQYGENSDQVQAIGLKKKSEYKRPTARTPAPKVPHA